MTTIVTPRPSIKTRFVELGLRVWNRMPPKMRRTLAWGAGAYASLSLVTDLIAGPAVVHSTIVIVNQLMGVA